MTTVKTENSPLYDKNNVEVIVSRRYYIKPSKFKKRITNQQKRNRCFQNPNICCPKSTVIKQIYVKHRDITIELIKNSTPVLLFFAH